MPSQFNSYIDNIDTDFWQDLCKNRGHLRHYDKGEAFITAGEVGRYIGYVESGALKYVCYSSDGTHHVIGLEFLYTIRPPRRPLFQISTTTL